MNSKSQTIPNKGEKLSSNQDQTRIEEIKREWNQTLQGIGYGRNTGKSNVSKKQKEAVMRKLFESMAE